MTEEKESEKANLQIRVGAKPFWKSRTLWFNVLAGLLVLADWAVVQKFSFITEEWFMMLVAIVNTILRFGTARPVANKGKLVTINKYG